ncbi:hypothetical protein Q7A_03780 [Methylophaga nitratireducenticrescens]|nr:hypothetical protein Q7A_03780 [Methylophaga nitratireducenticrescens]AUZ85276.1 hypothetical protein CDW43_12175 [Methylophaga nitratireducenticrescens]
MCDPSKQTDNEQTPEPENAQTQNESVDQSPINPKGKSSGNQVGNQGVSQLDLIGSKVQLQIKLIQLSLLKP